MREARNKIIQRINVSGVIKGSNYRQLMQQARGKIVERIKVQGYIWIHRYVRKDKVKVRGHWRTPPAEPQKKRPPKKKTPLQYWYHTVRVYYQYSRDPRRRFVVVKVKSYTRQFDVVDEKNARIAFYKKYDSDPNIRIVEVSPI